MDFHLFEALITENKLTLARATQPLLSAVIILTFQAFFLSHFITRLSLLYFALKSFTSERNVSLGFASQNKMS